MHTGHTEKLNITQRYGRGIWRLISLALNRYCIETSRVLPTCLQPVCTSQLTFRALCEFLTGVSMKTTIFWNVTRCSFIQTHWHFIAKCRFLPQYRGIITLKKKKQQITPKCRRVSNRFFTVLYARRR